MYIRNYAKPHQCQQCKKCFTDIHYLRRHVKHVHEDYKPHKCGKCEKSFTKDINLYYTNIRKNYVKTTFLLTRLKDPLRGSNTNFRYQGTQIRTFLLSKGTQIRTFYRGTYIRTFLKGQKHSNKISLFCLNFCVYEWNFIKPF